MLNEDFVKRRFLERMQKKGYRYVADLSNVLERITEKDWLKQIILLDDGFYVKKTDLKKKHKKTILTSKFRWIDATVRVDMDRYIINAVNVRNIKLSVGDKINVLIPFEGKYIRRTGFVKSLDVFDMAVKNKENAIIIEKIRKKVTDEMNEKSLIYRMLRKLGIKQ